MPLDPADPSSFVTTARLRVILGGYSASHARRVAREIGVRISPRKTLVSPLALSLWMTSHAAARASPSKPDEEQRPTAPRRPPPHPQESPMTIRLPSPGEIANDQPLQPRGARGGPLLRAALMRLTSGATVESDPDADLVVRRIGS